MRQCIQSLRRHLGRCAAQRIRTERTTDFVGPFVIRVRTWLAIVIVVIGPVVEALVIVQGRVDSQRFSQFLEVRGIGQTDHGIVASLRFIVRLTGGFAKVSGHALNAGRTGGAARCRVGLIGHGGPLFETQRPGKTRRRCGFRP